MKWHDGQPFTSKDVKFTFDMVREAPDATGKLRLNPRKDWYANSRRIEAADAHTVVFRLKRPQPSLLMMLASGYSPIYAAHVNPADYRTGCVGTGPFKVKEWRKGEFIEYVKNPDYFVKGRPYLDGLKYVIITERGTRVAALQAGQLDVAFPGETTKTVAEQLKKAVPGHGVHPGGPGVSDNIVMNTKKAPFDNPKVRLAVSYAIDRRGLIQAAHQGGAVLGAAMLPKPYGVWGMPEKDLLALPGYGKPPDDEGAGPEAPRARPGSPRTTAQGRDGDPGDRRLRGHGLLRGQRAQAGRHRGHAQAGRDRAVASDGDARRLPDRRQPHRRRRRRPRRQLLRELRLRLAAELQLLLRRGGERMFDQQSQELNPKKRLEMVTALQKKLEQDAARPVLAQRLDYYAHWPHVKNLVPHTTSTTSAACRTCGDK